MSVHGSLFLFQSLPCNLQMNGSCPREENRCFQQFMAKKEQNQLFWPLH